MRGPGNAFPVGVEQYLLRIKPQTPGRVERTRDPISLDLSRSNSGKEHMPVVIGAIPISREFDHSKRFGIVRMFKQQQLHFRGVLGKDAALATEILPKYRLKPARVFIDLHPSSFVQRPRSPHRPRRERAPPLLPRGGRKDGTGARPVWLPERWRRGCRPMSMSMPSMRGGLL
jgi:hypothetical protein